MSVRVNQARQHGDVRSKVDDCGSGGRFATLAHALNLVAADDDQHVVPRLRGNAVDQRGGVDSGDLFRGGGRSLLGQALDLDRQAKDQQDSRQNGSAAYHVAIPPVNERDNEYPFRDVNAI